MVLEAALHCLHGTQITVSLARLKRSADNGTTGESRGFGFVTFANILAAKVVLETCHFLGACRLNVRPAGCPGKTHRKVWVGDKSSMVLSGTENRTSEKSAVDIDPEDLTIYVGQLKPQITDYTRRTYFSEFGTVEEAEAITNRVTGESRGYGFVTFTARRAFERVLDTCHFLNECRLNVRPAAACRRKP
ncbi:unnamed protein product [Dibothriocephalus latus]|uniref:RRM domain-containing protein n=1 Tax=Dibothriocephalus latus TaxID=60516 RepID=A0A3P7LFK5_DIBLA|nr:unnamed protein product [Dibothriocephalus latus]